VSLAAWRTAYGSATGTSHARAGLPCQDAGRCDVVQADDGSEVLVASVADGAGSVSRSEYGARLVVDAFHLAFAEAGRTDSALGFLDVERARAWLAEVQGAIRALAAEECCHPRDYACTFLGAVIGPDCAVFMQIGDGAIVVDHTDGHAWVFWPQHGEFANSTFFVTMDDAAEILQFDRRDASDGHGPVRELAMFSDGLERLILNMTARTVHSPSLRPILGWLESTPPSCTGLPSGVLAAYLDSANVNRRTDDDKTLVMATRAGPVVAASDP
jgi:hypothetical protein